MQEGLRRKTLPEYLTDCSKCKVKQTKQIRQRLGCGYEVPIEKPRPWTPVVMDVNWKPASGQEVKQCPGFTCALPETSEVAQARVFAKEFGGLNQFCDEPMTPQVRQGLLILEGASNECQRWAMENVEKKS